MIRDDSLMKKWAISWHLLRALTSEKFFNGTGLGGLQAYKKPTNCALQRANAYNFANYCHHNPYPNLIPKPALEAGLRIRVELTRIPPSRKAGSGYNQDKKANLLIKGSAVPFFVEGNSTEFNRKQKG